MNLKAKSGADKRKADVFGYFVLSRLSIMVRSSTRGKSGPSRWKDGGRGQTKALKGGRASEGCWGGDLGGTMNGENSVKCKRNLGVDVCLSGHCVWWGGGVSLTSESVFLIWRHCCTISVLVCQGKCIWVLDLILLQKEMLITITGWQISKQVCDDIITTGERGVAREGSTQTVVFFLCLSVRGTSQPCWL